MNKSVELRLKRHRRVRSKVSGTAARPRLAVFRSLKHIYAQLIDDDAGVTLAAASSHEAPARGEGVNGGNIVGASYVGKLIAQRGIEKGVLAVVYDRGGFRYHGRVKTLADAAREAGLQF